MTTTMRALGATVPAAPEDPRRVELVAALRSLADLIESRPDLEVSPRHADLSVGMSTRTRAGLDGWAAVFGAEVRYQPYEPGRVIPYIAHQVAPTLRVNMQSRAEPDPRPDPRDAEITRLRALLAANGAGRAGDGAGHERDG